ncbi:MAG: hypothetical protein EPN60_12070, partial [Nevskiaceae bacterium]
MAGCSAAFAQMLWSWQVREERIGAFGWGSLWFARSRSADIAGLDSFFSPLGDSLFFAPAKKSKQKKAGPCVA